VKSDTEKKAQVAVKEARVAVLVPQAPLSSAIALAAAVFSASYPVSVLFAAASAGMSTESVMVAATAAAKVYVAVARV
jgi:hypothetical protein